MRKKDRALPIGAQIKLRRIELGLTIEGTDISGGRLSRIESGENLPALPTLESLAQGLTCTFVIGPKETYLEPGEG